MHRFNFLVSLLLVIGHIVANELPIVKTPLGTVSGYHRSFNGKTFSSFEGIPYAKPPLGSLRFEPPEPIEPWAGTWEATTVTECVQNGLVKLTSIQGEEDCLYINVYVPRESINPKEKLDVMVHIHGGAFIIGSGHIYSNPEFFMDKDIIFVTFNYRLGIFGFLSTEDDVISGNMGLKDQVLALKWVQKNIASFGGNPKSVTLTGLSAGASSVHFHYLSETSKNLFHRGFSQSGVALNPWCLQDNPLDKAKMLARAVGCNEESTQEFVKCLKQRNSRHLITKMKQFFGYLFMPFSPFAPVVEKGKNPFLSKHPYEVMKNGEMQDLPWMVSMVAHEGLLPAAFFYNDMEKINDEWENIVQYILDFNNTLPSTEFKKAAEQIKKFYLQDNNLNTENFEKIIKIFSDRLFLVDAEVSAKLFAEKYQSSVYFYLFSYPGDNSQNNTVSHGDDGNYFFYNMFQKKNLSENELKMKDIMVDMLISFTKTGKPVIPGVQWDSTGSNALSYLNIKSFEKNSIQMEQKVDVESQNFWYSLGIQENQNLLNIKDEL